VLLPFLSRTCGSSSPAQTIGHQLDRLDRWVHELAAKIGDELTA
jgi:hypothetical protein